MAEITPPLFETVPGVYTGADLGLPYRDTIAQGVVGASDLSVVQRASGANMSVDVGSGVAWVAGDESVLQPTYRVYNDATVNLVIAAADATNPRIDIVIAEVRDASFAGVSTDWRLRVVTGTAAASPAVPATPNNSLKLADVSVPALDTTIATAQITDKRSRAMVGGPLAPAYVTALPPEPYDGQEVYYAADPTNGVIWHLRYRAASASSYKWEYVGGSALSAFVATAEARTGASATDSFFALATAGPSVTVPLAGEYVVSVECAALCSAANDIALMSYDIGASPATDARAGLVVSLTNVGYVNLRRLNRHAVAAGEALVSKYRYGGPGGGASATFFQRALTAVPIRVG